MGQGRPTDFIPNHVWVVDMITLESKRVRRSIFLKYKGTRLVRVRSTEGQALIKKRKAQEKERQRQETLARIKAREQQRKEGR